MGWFNGVRRRVVKGRRAAMGSEAGSPAPVSVNVARPRYRAGETVVALVDGGDRPVRAALVRVERRPCGEGVVVMDAQDLREPFGVLELQLPAGALPTAAGRGCALSYAVQVRARGRVVRAPLEVSAAARPRAATGSSGGGALIAGWDARHFHLELDGAVLCGGGWIAGRVQRHGPPCSGAVSVRLRCDECWEPGGPAARGMPYWQSRTLWTAEELLRLDSDLPWAPLRFELPPGLPPAIEGRTIAWRYELRARRRRRHRPDETAALTPLLYDERAGQ